MTTHAVHRAWNRRVQDVMLCSVCGVWAWDLPQGDTASPNEGEWDCPECAAVLRAWVRTRGSSFFPMVNEQDRDLEDRVTKALRVIEERWTHDPYDPRSLVDDVYDILKGKQGAHWEWMKAITNKRS